LRKIKGGSILNI